MNPAYFRRKLQQLPPKTPVRTRRLRKIKRSDGRRRSAWECANG